MYLVYLDESGNTGTNFTDTQQPVFALAALVIPEASWLRMETELENCIERHFPSPRPLDFEVHANELVNPRGYFRQFPVRQRLDFLAEWMRIGEKHKVRVIYRAIVKKRFARWLHETFGAGVVINPHIAAFALVAEVVNDYLRSISDTSMGILILDENKEVGHDVEKALRVLRVDESELRLSQIIEKGFFIESHKSIFLQYCDVCAFAIRRMEEQKAGIAVKKLDAQLVPMVRPLIHRGPEPLPDVLTWLEEQQKKGAARD